MRFEQLRQKIIKYPLFTSADVLKWFPKTDIKILKTQLSQWLDKGYLRKIKRNLFYLAEIEISDQFYLAEKILSPSYISLESALNYYSIIPDIPQSVTLVSPLITRKFATPLGKFYYYHLKPDYFFGFKTIYSPDKKFFYNIASQEKALLDFIYFNLMRLKKLENFEEERFYFSRGFSWPKFLKMSKVFKNKNIYKIAKKIKYEQTSNKI